MNTETKIIRTKAALSTVMAMSLCLFAAVQGQAASLTDIGGTAPTPGANDISQLLTTGGNASTDGLNYYDNNSPVPGQTFTTGGNVSGYTLSSLAYQYGTSWGNSHNNAQVYTLRIYSVGAAATLVATYTSGSVAVTAGHWVQWTGLSTSLQPNTTYAYTVACTTGFNQLIVASGNPYAGGEICLIQSAGGTVTVGSTHGYDAAFDVGLTLPSSSVSAAPNDDWNGGSSSGNNWSDSANWNGVTPSQNDFLTFDGSTRTSPNNNLSSYTFGNIAFAYTAGASFTLGGNAVTLGNPVLDAGGNSYGGSLVNLSPSAQTVNSGMTLSAGNHVIGTGSGAGSLTLPSSFTASSGATVQFVQSGAAINSGLSLVNGIIGGYALYSSSSANSFINNNGGPGTVDWATVSSGAVAALSSGSYTAVSGSGKTIASSASSNVKVTSNGSSNDKIGSGTTIINTLNWVATTQNGYIDVPASATWIFGAQGGIIMNANKYLRIGNGNSSSLTAGGAANTSGTLSIYNLSYYSANAVEFWGTTLTDNGGSSHPMTVNAYGSVKLDQACTYSGGTYINAGDFYWNSGNGVNAPFGTGPIYVFPGGRADLINDQSATIANNFYLSGNGFIANANYGAIGCGYNSTYTGTITLLANAAIAVPNSSTFSGQITGSGGLTAIGAGGAGSLHLDESSANNYTGDTVIDATTFGLANNAITIWVDNPGHNNIMPNGSGYGNLILKGGSSTLAQFDIGGSTQTINGLSSSGTAANANVTSNPGGGVLNVGGNNATSTFGGTIGIESGIGTASISLNKTGTGTLTLGGTNNFTGNTTISNGVLALTGTATLAGTPKIILAGGSLDVSALSSTFNLASGQTLLVTNPGTVNGAFAAPTGGIINLGTNTLTQTGNLTLSGGTVNYTLDIITNGNNGAIAVTGNLTLSGASTIHVTYTTLGAGRYKLITYTGSETGTAAGNLILTGASSSGRQTAVLDDSVSGEIDLLVSSGAPASDVWTGADANNPTRWNNTQTDTNWYAAGAADLYHYFDADSVTFNDSNNGQYTVNIASTVQPASILVTNGAGNYTFNGTGQITGAAGLVKDGSGTLTLADSGNDNFSGGITVSNGTVVIDSVQSVTGGGLITANGTLQLGNNDANGTLPSGTVTDNGSITINRNDTGLTISSVIGGSGTVVNNGSGTVTLTAANTFSGGLTVANGTVKTANAGLGTTGAGSGTVTVNSGATLVGTTADGFGYGGTGASSISINGTVTDLGTSSYRITMPNLTFNGGTLTSAAGNNGDGNGNYSFDNGTVNVMASSTTASISAQKVSLQTGVNFNVASGTTPSGVDLAVSSIFVNFGVNTLTKSGAGVMLLDTNSPNWSSPVVISAGTLQVGQASDSSALTAPLGTGAVTNNATLNVASSQSVTISNTISGTGALTQNSASTLTLYGNSINWTGAVSVASGGTLKFGAANAVGRGTNTPITISSGATLDFNGIANHTNAVIVSGTGVGGNGAIINSGADAYPVMAFMTMTGNTTIGGSGRWDIRSAAGTGGNPALAALSTGGNAYNLTIAPASKFIGIVATTVDPALANIDIKPGATLDIEGNTTGLGNPADNLTVEGGATLYLYQPTNQLNKVFVLNDAATINNSSGNNTIIGPVTLSSGNATNYNSSGTSLTVDGNITGAGSLTENGNGTLVLNGINGALTVTVNGRTLAGTGTIGAATLNAGTVLSPGVGNVGTLVFSNSLTLNAASTNNFTVTTAGGASNRVAVAGALTPNSSVVEINTAGTQLDVGTNVLFTYGSSSGSFTATPVFDTVQTGAATNAVIVDDMAGSIKLVVANPAPAVSSDASVSFLALSPAGTLAPAFDPGMTNYTANEANTNSSVSVLVTNTSAYATNVLFLNGAPLATNVGSLTASVPLVVGSGNELQVQVTAQDGLTVSNYFVTVTRVASTNAYLTSLVLSNAAGALALNPTFDGSNPAQGYLATNDCANTAVTVLVTNADATATDWLITSSSTNQIWSGTNSLGLTLTTGANSVTVQVVSQDLTVTNNYVVAVNVPVPVTVSVNSTNIYAGGSATLVATTSAGSPTYLWSDSETTASITVTPSTNTTYTVTVTDGTTGCIGGNSGTVTILPSTNALLASLSLTPAGTLFPTFVAGTTGYNATNTYLNNPVTVAAMSADANATLALSLNGGGYGSAVTNSLSIGGNTLVLPANTVAVRVVSQDLSQTNVYTVNVLLQPSATMPKLTNSVSGNNLVLSWPTDHLGYRLLVQTNNLNKGVSGNINDWGTVAGSQSITATNIAIIKSGVTNQYYKLVYP